MRTSSRSCKTRWRLVRLSHGSHQVRMRAHRWLRSQLCEGADGCTISRNATPDVATRVLRTPQRARHLMPGMPGSCTSSSTSKTARGLELVQARGHDHSGLRSGSGSALPRYLAPVRERHNVGATGWAAARRGGEISPRSGGGPNVAVGFSRSERPGRWGSRMTDASRGPMARRWSRPRPTPCSRRQLRPPHTSLEAHW